MRPQAEYIAIYSRKSKFTGKGESIGNQIELCKAYIRLHYGEEALKRVIIFEDEGFSGGNINRPAFKKMMKAAREYRFHAIVVYRLDRISRNISDFSGLIAELTRLDIAFISIREQFDTATPMGRAMMYIASVFSQLERETIAERIRDNMHELAKTGRWLGGVTPTGYESESVESVTVDGKRKKVCKLKLIPDEAETVKLIFDLFLENCSLTKTEAELLKRDRKTKNGKGFTRFALKGILQNPVYVIADEEAYRYFTEKDADLFSERSEFDGVHGLVAYNRTDQGKGGSKRYNPVEEWIVSVGQHPGLIPGKRWVRVQELLEQNKSKAYRRPRSNESLLTGLLFCRCGSRMYPKLGKRRMADGSLVFSYVCKLKERSQQSQCRVKNVNGNTLDQMVVEQIKQLEEDGGSFLAQLEKSRRFYVGDRTQYEEKLDGLRRQREERERKIQSLVDSLVELEGSTAKQHIAKRMEQLNQEWESITLHIQELEGLTARHIMNEEEFELMRQLLSVFCDSLDEMNIDQKRAAIRTLVRKVIWDGCNAHVILFGATEGEMEYPDVLPSDREEKIETGGSGASVTRLCEDRKRDPDVSAQDQTALR